MRPSRCASRNGLACSIPRSMRSSSAASSPEDSLWSPREIRTPRPARDASRWHRAGSAHSVRCSGARSGRHLHALSAMAAETDRTRDPVRYSQVSFGWRPQADPFAVTVRRADRRELSLQPTGGLFRYFQMRSAVTPISPPISPPIVPATAPGQFLEMKPSITANKTPSGITIANTIAKSRGRFIPSYCHGVAWPSQPSSSTE